MDPSERLQFLFLKYLQRRCEPGEVEELTGLLQRSDAGETLDGPMKALWQQIKEKAVEYPVNWDKMYEAVSNTEEDLPLLNRQRNNKIHRIGYRMAVASVLLLVAAGVYWETGRKGKDHPGPAPVTATPMEAVQPLSKKQVIHLPDGGTVILNTNSKLDYPVAFAGPTREVYLTGEAYFDITHRAGHPFLVHTGKITTRVLGTAFNIRAYPADEAVEVTVTHGKVQVLEENKSVGLLTDDQQIRFSKTTEHFVQQKVDTRSITAWKPTEISFDDITMEEAARRVEQRFHVTVDFVNPALKDCRVTATFYDDDGLSEIMTVICGVSQSNFNIQNNKIVIEGKGCN